MQNTRQPQQTRSLRALYGQACKTASPQFMMAKKREAIRQLLQLAAIGGLGGAGFRGLQELHGATSSPAAISPSQRLPRAVNLVTGKPDETEKLAEWPEPGGTADNLIQRFTPDITTTNELGDWWGPTAGIGTIMAALYGGYKGADKLLGSANAGAEENEMEAAKEEYRKALAEQYRAAMMAKRGEDELGLDDIYDAFHEKQAGADGMETLDSMYGPTYGTLGNAILPGTRTSHDGWRGLIGAALASMALAGGGSAAATYNWAKPSNKQEILRKALKRREQLRKRMSPPPIYATVEDEENAAA